MVPSAKSLSAFDKPQPRCHNRPAPHTPDKDAYTQEYANCPPNRRSYTRYRIIILPQRAVNVAQKDNTTG